MQQSCVIELQKEFFDFSAGHFTLFSKQQRENLHGHNYHVALIIRCRVCDKGLNFDYRFYKEKLREILKQLDQTTLIATRSPYSRVEEQADWVIVHFNDERIPFLKRDVTLLPITNTTVEELSRWILEALRAQSETMPDHQINAMEVKVYSNLAQAGSTSWSQSEDSKML
jgi:6-pyruvoyltetrahydropterin/6-carboxytetrahydropterin synthase